VTSNAVQHDVDASRRVLKLALDGEIDACRRCKGMNIDGVPASAPGYGCSTSPVALAVQSLCEKCMETQIPFTGGSGDLIDASVELAGQTLPGVALNLLDVNLADAKSTADPTGPYLTRGRTLTQLLP